MTGKTNKGFVTNGKYFSNMSMKPVQLHNDNVLDAKESFKSQIRRELENLENTNDITCSLAKIASLASIYLDLDSKDSLNTPYILINKITNHICITREEPDEKWIEALSWDSSTKPNKNN